MSDAPKFRNVDPKTRSERYENRDKDAWEKARLRERSAATRKQEIVVNPVIPVSSSPAYIDERNRFNQDAAGEIQREKEEAMQKKQTIYEMKRLERYEKEQTRWKKIESVERRQEAHFQNARETGIGAHANLSSEHYNILTLDYKNTPQGQALKQKDIGVMKRAEIRADVLFRHNHSVSHNIITGEPLKEPPRRELP
uniref:Uncharacterized protein n=1 Tax=Polytomella parva TaxID=51329 RepID=A0A7S0UNQ3_9CHLO|mmetsp:Transcript_12514/g.22396  ORF Transcript_12514/g.22396 Transcript_12514/m.22396 type:complete len:197 (+) Transcript_12514:87-677(+)|eukprot:CAMPEP_0175061060 /NCGR_PEP_ID=MMETSP0052_2-20121109/13378_1 /TAXON_ID=51329 ORGANISM="Polytomella parva, Strain SAG 63-3" /NCGR_SAMPLE_ID=MMETSP0052_2 /ASSEMBLY_ACC=CAM_ASM_000194 /LENGTH=196 /DNA_ID=CAMNT_0016326879 /DNA_START=87 /DNA_END=677 /DNA_ORIENTATION=-